jgi:hypothetical protein
LAHTAPGAAAVRTFQRPVDAARNLKLFNQVTPDAAITKSGQEGQRQLAEAFKQAYENIWKQDFKVMLEDGTELAAREVEAMHKELPRLATAATRRGDLQVADALNAQHDALLAADQSGIVAG